MKLTATRAYASTYKNAKTYIDKPYAYCLLKDSLPLSLDQTSDGESEKSICLFVSSQVVVTINQMS